MRQCPEIPAKEFKLKTVKKGLDNKMWIVSKRTDGIKVWKRKPNKSKGGSNTNKYSINYSRFNKIIGNENLNNVYNSGTIVTGKNNLRPLVTGKKNIVSNLINHDEGLLIQIMDYNLTGYELKNLMLTSKKWYNVILKNLLFLLPQLKDSKEIYNIMLRKILNIDLPKDDKLYINYNKVRNHINNSNKKNLLKLVSTKNNKISIRVSNNKKSIIDEILIKLSERNQEYLLQLFTYASNIALLKQGVLVIPAGTIVIDNNDYKDDKLNTVIIPDSVTTISDYAFTWCSSLIEITIPDSVISIGRGVFSNCNSLSKITIPDSVTTIGNVTFAGCYSLIEITIPELVVTIGNSAFSGCSSLSEIIIPDSVTTIGGNAFNGCSSLSEIIIPESVTTIGNYTFYDCRSLSEITIPEYVTTIDIYAFSRCTSLRKITIPDSVTTICDNAFSVCSSLREIIIPDSVTTIGSYVFYGCRSLTDIYVSQNRINSNNNISIIEKSIENSRLSSSNINIIPY